MAETGLFSDFWFWAWMIFMTGLRVALAERGLNLFFYLSNPFSQHNTHETINLFVSQES